MIKVIVAIKRLPEMTAEDFHEHWYTRHADLVKSNPASKKYIKKYIQCHTLAGEYHQGEVAYDGTAEIWFATLEDKDAFFSDADYLRDIKPDEGRFADMTRTVFFVTEEKTVIEG